MKENRNAIENYRLFATELLQEVKKRDLQGLGISNVQIREKEANWQANLDIGREYSSPVREFMDIGYGDRTVTLDLQYAYGDYRRGMQIDEIGSRFFKSIEVTVKGDIRNIEYAKSVAEEIQEEGMER